jgi:hypothetical protein
MIQIKLELCVSMVLLQLSITRRVMVVVQTKQSSTFKVVAGAKALHLKMLSFNVFIELKVISVHLKITQKLLTKVLPFLETLRMT